MHSAVPPSSSNRFESSEYHPKVTTVIERKQCKAPKITPSDSVPLAPDGTITIEMRPADQETTLTDDGIYPLNALNTDIVRETLLKQERYDRDGVPLEKRMLPQQDNSLPPASYDKAYI